MNLLADESVERQIAERLGQDGHRVRYVVEMEQWISGLISSTISERRL